MTQRLARNIAGGACASPVFARGASIALTAALILAGCGEDQPRPGPGGVTVGEARALDEAAEMLDARSLPEAGPAPAREAAGPAETRPD